MKTKIEPLNCREGRKEDYLKGDTCGNWLTGFKVIDVDVKQGKVKLSAECSSCGRNHTITLSAEEVRRTENETKFKSQK